MQITDTREELRGGFLSFHYLDKQTSILLAILGQLYYDRKCISTLGR